MSWEVAAVWERAYNLLGTTASLASLVLTVYLVVAARALHDFYLRHLQLPKIGSRLQACQRNLHAAVGVKDFEGIRRELQKCDAIMARVLRHVDADLAERAKSIREEIRTASSASADALVRSGAVVGAKLIAILEGFAVFLGEDKWDRPA